MNAMKVAIMGYSGAGKSTLAAQLGGTLHCPVLHLDRVHWLPGWQERESEEAREIVLEFMQQDAWVIDGNYGDLHRDSRMAEADLIVLLLFSRFCKAFKSNLSLRGAFMLDECALFFCVKAAPHQNPHNGSHHQTACPAAGVAEAMKPCEVCA